MSIQGVNLSSFVTAMIMAIPILFIYSSRIDKSRVVAIATPLVITQARKTPAFYLYQQAQKLESKRVDPEVKNTTFLNTESAAEPIRTIALTEMKLDRQEIGSDQDYGFQVVKQKQKVLPALNKNIMAMAVTSENKPSILQPNSSSLQKWGTVRGKFEVKDGVGVIDHIVEVRRMEEGQVRELGQVDLRAGLYSIDIENPQGYLIAQIKDRNGVIIGEDRQKIINLASHGNYFEGPFIRVGKPSGMGANPSFPNNPSSSNVVSNSRGQAQQKSHEEPSTIIASLFSNQHQLEKSKDQFGNISRNSSTISLIEDQKNVYAKIISIRQTADETETPLFTKKWLSGTLDYISDHQKIEFKSKSPPVLIGQVLGDGKSVKGAYVQLENHPGINVIYLDQFMIPNFKQEGTSENGYFLFVGLEEDNYSAVAFQNNKIIGQQIFIAEEKAISYQHISSSTTPRTILVRSFDAFTSLPVDADVIAPDVEDVVDVQQGFASYRTNNALGISNYIVRPKQNYMPINYIQDARLNHIHLPAINEAWLSTIQSTLQINDEVNTGTIIGFVPDLDYEMYIISEDYQRNQIAYFNQQGMVTAQPTRGGGFILFNVPIGAQEIVVQEKKTERIFSQVHIVKVNQTSVSHFTE